MRWVCPTISPCGRPFPSHTAPGILQSRKFCLSILKKKTLSSFTEEGMSIRNGRLLVIEAREEAASILKMLSSVSGSKDEPCVTLVFVQ